MFTQLSTILFSAIRKRRIPVNVTCLPVGATPMNSPWWVPRLVQRIDGAELQPWPEPQRYTRLKTGDGGWTYRFVSLDGGFSADLPVDQDGLVLDYPGLFRRVFP
jgi:hypothetical protein